MADFVIYKYVFKKSEEKHLALQTLEGDNVELTAQEILDRHLIGKTLSGICKKERDGNLMPLENNIVSKADGVTLLTICDNKKVTYWDQYQKKQMESHPYSYVIIDNRENVAQIAIERNSAFGTKDGPDKVKNILNLFFNSVLATYGWTIEIKRKARSIEVWDMVEDRIRLKDTVKSVRFNFCDPAKTEAIDATEAQLAQMRMLASLSRAMGAVSSYLQLDATANGALILDREQKDLAGMVALCSNNGWDIDITFRDFGTYRVGRLQSAVFSTTQEVINDFANGQISWCDGEEGVHFRLVQWLNDVRRYTKDFNYEEQNKKRCKRKVKKKPVK